MIAKLFRNSIFPTKKSRYKSRKSIHCTSAIVRTIAPAGAISLRCNHSTRHIFENFEFSKFRCHEAARLGYYNVDAHGKPSTMVSVRRACRDEPALETKNKMQIDRIQDRQQRPNLPTSKISTRHQIVEIRPNGHEKSPKTTILFKIWCRPKIQNSTLGVLWMKPLKRTDGFEKSESKQHKFEKSSFFGILVTNPDLGPITFRPQ